MECEAEGVKLWGYCQVIGVWCPIRTNVRGEPVDPLGQILDFQALVLLSLVAREPGGAMPTGRADCKDYRDRHHR